MEVSANIMRMVGLPPHPLTAVEHSIDLVRSRLLRATHALEAAGVPYAVVGGNAVAAFVSEVDVAAVRTTRDVDLMIRRVDLERVVEALAAEGFHHRQVAGIDLFLEGLDGRVRDAVHVVFANETVREGEALPNPDIEPHREIYGIRFAELESVVQMKLTDWRRKDQTHLDDLISLGIVDADWLPKFPTVLRERLQFLLDNPESFS